MMKNEKMLVTVVVIGAVAAAAYLAYQYANSAECDACPASPDTVEDVTVEKKPTPLMPNVAVLRSDDGNYGNAGITSGLDGSFQAFNDNYTEFSSNAALDMFDAISPATTVNGVIEIPAPLNIMSSPDSRVYSAGRESRGGKNGGIVTLTAKYRNDAMKLMAQKDAEDVIAKCPVQPMNPTLTNYLVVG